MQNPSFGFKSLDAHLDGGFPPGSVVTLCGPASVGKSALAVNIADRNAAQGVGVLYITFEFSKDLLVQRFLALRSGVPAGRIRHNRLDAYEAARVKAAAEETKPIILADRVGKRGIEAAIKEAKEKSPVSLVIVDYLDALGNSIEETMRRLKSAAVAESVAILGITYMRTNEKTGFEYVDGALGECSDLIVVMHHGRIGSTGWVSGKGESPGAFDIVVRTVKNRHGRNLCANFIFMPTFMRFGERHEDSGHSSVEF